MDYSELKARLLDHRLTDPVAFTCRQAAEAITTLEARIAQLEADRAQWVELPRLTLGRQE